MTRTSVAGVGGGWGGNCPPPPPPIMLFRNFLGTIGNLSVQVSRQVCHLYRQLKNLKYMYQQNIERNSSSRMWKCIFFLSSLAPLAGIL